MEFLQYQTAILLIINLKKKTIRDCTVAKKFINEYINFILYTTKNTAIKYFSIKFMKSQNSLIKNWKKKLILVKVDQYCACKIIGRLYVCSLKYINYQNYLQQI